MKYADASWQTQAQMRLCWGTARPQHNIVSFKVVDIFNVLWSACPNLRNFCLKFRGMVGSFTYFFLPLPKDSHSHFVPSFSTEMPFLGTRKAHR